MSTFRGRIIKMDMKENEIIHIAIENLQKNAGIKGKWNQKAKNNLDGELTLQIENNTIKFFAEIKQELRNHQLLQVEQLAENNNPFIIVANRIFPKIKAHLREQKIAYLEANGNIYFNEKGYHYFIDTQKTVEQATEKLNRAFTKTGLKVLFHFLLDEHLVNLPHREIATITKVAHGNIAYILTGLKEYQFLLKLNKDDVQLNNRKGLLEKWMVAYKETLQPTLQIGQFRFNKKENYLNWHNIKLHKGKTFWGGEPAGDLLTNHLRPGEFTLYTTENRNELIKNYRLIPDKEGDIFVYKKFWNEKFDKKNTVPAVLAYVDLMNVGDKRCRETAQIIYNQYVGPNL